MSEKAGREVPKEYRDVVNHQIERHGWRYDAGSKRGGHPMLYPSNRDFRPIPVSTTPSDRRGFLNFVGQVKRAGGTWPPGKES